ncbi:TPA: hypothetical protein O4I60_004337 [Vibrio parahaemolyticus]|nr:hypothetical protein [Vibrio parahaemolyticus]
MKHKIITAIIGSSLLSACGGGSSSSSAPAAPVATASIQGKAIDGYITGATVYLDYNFNNQLDAGEPSAITGEYGAYDLQLTGKYADCADYAPLVLDVPVGATDSDFGEITEAYQMVTPPAFAASTTEELRHLTPLSTIIWTSIEAELKTTEEATFTTCDDVKNNYAVREAIKTRVSEQEWRFANRYSITVDEMYGDYVASGNTTLHAEAAALVPSLQKSYDETKTLEAAHPSAGYVYIEYFHGRYDEIAKEFDDKWYREEYVGYTTSWTKAIEEYNSDLDTNLGLAYKEVGKEDTQNGITYELRREFDDNQCAVNEYIRQAENNNMASYGIRNIAYATVANFSDCASLDLASNLSKRLLLTNDGKGSYSEHQYEASALVGFDNLINRENSYISIDTNELTAINFISTDFNDTAMYDADYYLRTKSTESTNATTLTTRDSSGVWTRTTLQRNGIQTTECSTDGNVWSSALNTSQCYQ